MPQANQRISEYLLDARVGGGTFGEVWRAHHHVWVDQVVAIKLPSDPQYLRNLQREGLTVHGLLHPNIVRAIGFDPYADPPYLVMEYVPGTSLRPLIQNRSISVPDSIAVLRQVLRGLAYANAAGLVHRDIKPENILIHERAARDGLAADGVVKITDFGLGRPTGGGAGGSGGGGAESIAFSASMNSPAGRDIAGTLDYMAPEQRAGASPDARGDIYSCGVVLYEMLTGERPAGTELPSDRNPQVPAIVDNLYKRSYARLERRYKSAEEFIADLPPASALAVGAAGAAVAVRPGIAAPAANMGFPGAAPPPMPHAQISPAAGTQTLNRQVCPRCRQLFDAGDQFCMHCGTQLVAVVRRCPRCGAYPDGTDRYCIFCGETLQLARPVSA